MNQSIEAKIWQKVLQTDLLYEAIEYRIIRLGYKLIYGPIYVSIWRGCIQEQRTYARLEGEINRS